MVPSAAHWQARAMSARARARCAGAGEVRVVGADEAKAAVDDAGGIEPAATGAEADDDAAAEGFDEAEGEIERVALRAAVLIDAIEDEVELARLLMPAVLARVQHVGGAEGKGHLPAEGDRVGGDDLLDAHREGALHGGEADRAAAEDEGALPRAGVGIRHAAQDGAEELEVGALLPGEVIGDPAEGQLRGANDEVLGERAVGQIPGEAVADGQATHVLADLSDDAGGLVPERVGVRPVIAPPIPLVDIRPAQDAAFDLNQGFISIV